MSKKIEELIAHLFWLADADEGDPISSADLAKCEEAASLLQDIVSTLDQPIDGSDMLDVIEGMLNDE